MIEETTMILACAIVYSTPGKASFSNLGKRLTGKNT
jgi:hypothetical protein